MAAKNCFFLVQCSCFGGFVKKVDEQKEVGILEGFPTLFPWVIKIVAVLQFFHKQKSPLSHHIGFSLFPSPTHTHTHTHEVFFFYSFAEEETYCTLGPCAIGRSITRVFHVGFFFSKNGQRESHPLTLRHDKNVTRPKNDIGLARYFKNITLKYRQSFGHFRNNSM